MPEESTSTSKNPPINTNEKSSNCSTLRCRSIFSSFFAAFLSNCSSSSKSLITTNVGAGGENCL
jgi:hypothetical protein